MSHLPSEIKTTVMWDEHHMSMSAYSIYREELEDICRNFEVGQLNLFTFVRERILCEWIGGTFHREPVAIYVDQIIY